MKFNEQQTKKLAMDPNIEMNGETIHLLPLKSFCREIIVVELFHWMEWQQKKNENVKKKTTKNGPPPKKKNEK